MGVERCGSSGINWQDDGGLKKLARIPHAVRPAVLKRDCYCNPECDIITISNRFLSLIFSNIFLGLMGPAFGET